MLRLIARCSCLVALLVIGHFTMAQEFSADVINSRGGESIKKIYATKDKVRFEMEGQDAQMGSAVLIADEAQGKWLVILPQRRVYMDSWPPMMKRPTIAQVWHVEDVNNACAQWKTVAQQAGSTNNWGSCTKVGGDTLHGRSAVKYEGVSTKGDKDYYWVDTKLHCVIKMEGGTGGGIELTNIQEGSQPSRLFEVPAGFTKVDLAALIGQMSGRQR